jgi:hypothetical protein
MQNNAHNETRQTIPDFSRLARIVDSLFYQPCHAGLAHEQSDVNHPGAAKKPLLRRLGAIKNVVEAMFRGCAAGAWRNFSANSAALIAANSSANSSNLLHEAPFRREFPAIFRLLSETGHLSSQKHCFGMWLRTPAAQPR